MSKETFLDNIYDIGIFLLAFLTMLFFGNLDLNTINITDDLEFSFSLLTISFTILTTVSFFKKFYIKSFFYIIFAIIFSFSFPPVLFESSTIAITIFMLYVISMLAYTFYINKKK